MELSPNSKQIIIKLLSLLVFFWGMLAVIGWIFNFPRLTSISASWISMKFDTAITFMISGISLYFIFKAQDGEFDFAQVVLFTTSLLIALFMGVFLLSTLFGIQTGLEDLFVREAPVSPKTIIPGKPSLPTMLNFLLIALAGILAMINVRNLRKKLKIIGSLVGLTGLLAICGYLINVPVLYYYIAGLNSAMAFSTAVLFVLLGLGLLCL